MGMSRRRVVVVCALAMLAPGVSASAAGGGVENKPARTCPPTFERVTIERARAIVEPILVTQPVDELIAYFDNVIDQNADDVVCLRIGPPDANPHFGGLPRILAIDNTRR